MKYTSGIYRIRNIINDLGYVGSSKAIESRFWGHRSSLRKNEHHSPHLQYAWFKYGEENFSFEILEVIENPTKENLEAREQYWIDYYNSANKKYGYNVCKKAYSCFGVKRSKRETTNKNKELILEFCKTNGYRPSRRAENFKERHLGNLLDSYVKKIHDSYDYKFRKIILFYPSARSYTSQQVKNNILNFIKENGHLPSDCSKDINEAKLGKTLQYIREKTSYLYDPIIVEKIVGIPTAQKFNKLVKVNSNGKC